MAKIMDFNTASIPAIDRGAAALAFDEAIKHLLMDCEDRPAIDSKRSVTLTVEMRPVLSACGRLGSIKTTFTIGNPKLPKRHTKEYEFQVGGTGDTIKAGFVPSATMDEATADWVEEQREADEAAAKACDVVHARPRPIEELESGTNG